MTPEIQQIIEQDAKKYWALEDSGGLNADTHFAAGINAVISNPGRYGISGMRWVKASVDIPKSDDILPVRIDGMGKALGNFFRSEETGDFAFHVRPNGVHDGWIVPESKFDGIEWLDESSLAPDTTALGKEIERLNKLLKEAYAYGRKI